ncbi:hypothetical protein OPT61_g8971 [Boeremia exigua]|uniref:Uncharacterized protein n=1 Tax=Boeremia exigua TaxID=749465 RepID=A0ACC2HWE0_9PLEO|nr:hypothetical protein OPT61_g8971 [Boeremia exigua]
MTSSATERELLNGELNTAMPFSAAVCRSTCELGLGADTHDLDVADLLDQLVLGQTALERLDLVALLLEDLNASHIDILQQQHLDLLCVEGLQALRQLAGRQHIAEAAGQALAEAAARRLAEAVGRAVELEVGARREAVGHLARQVADAACDVLWGAHGLTPSVDSRFQRLEVFFGARMMQSRLSPSNAANTVRDCGIGRVVGSSPAGSITP